MAVAAFPADTVSPEHSDELARARPHRRAKPPGAKDDRRSRVSHAAVDPLRDRRLDAARPRAWGDKRDRNRDGGASTACGQATVAATCSGQASPDEQERREGAGDPATLKNEKTVKHTTR